MHSFSASRFALAPTVAMNATIIAALLLCSVAVADQPAAAQADVLPPGAAEIVRLQVEPAAIELTNEFAYAQLIATAITAEGEKIDVTRAARFDQPEELLTVSERGLVRPAQDGTGELSCTFGGQTARVSVKISGLKEPYEVDYIRDINPVLSKLGCNAGTCHGAKDGKNGFKLSLRGYDPLFDVRALVDDLGARRINLASPERSLMLLKATGSVPHVGGQVTEPDGIYYHMLRRWISGGVKLDLETPRVKSIRLSPINPVVQRERMKQQMRVLAEYGDGMLRDVTAEAFVETGNQDVATVDKTGLVTVHRRGEAAILARFEGAYAATTVTVMGDRQGFEWTQPPANNYIDELVYEKLERTKTLASGLCTDAEFIRRVYLDLTGLPPTAEAVAAFLADQRDTRTKRDELVDKLVGSAEYVEHFTNKWADLLQVNRKFLGEQGAAAFRNWIKQAVATNMPHDEFAYRILTASGSNRENPAASYWKILRDPADTMENTTHLFLAVRFNCNKCHDHPFERWTQDQYYHLAAYFSRVGLKKDPASGDQAIGRTAVESAKPLYEVVFDKGSGEVTHDRTGQVAQPEFPFTAEYDQSQAASRREQLARWITSPDNRYFASSYVNRLWGHLTGVGLIEPIDDIRAGNPPTNPKLLDRLEEQFIQSGFDTQEIIATICKSRTYQLSVKTNKWNEDDRINYSHATARRLPAEVLFDTVHKVTGSTPRLPGMPEGMRAAALPDVGVKLPSGFLDQFGRPARQSACECERTSNLMLGPVMALVNGPTIANAIADPQNAIAYLAANEPDDEKVIEQLFMRILNRPPTESELVAGKQAMHGPQRDHQRLVEELAQYEQKFAGQIEAWKQEQEKKIVAAREALAAYEKELPSRMTEWEARLTRSGGWQPLMPHKLESSSGAELAVEEKAEHPGAVFVTGKKALGSYTLVADTPLTQITGLRLELLPDERLPAQGPGRAPNGNFVLNEFTLQVSPRQGSDPAQPVKLTSAQADFSQQGFDVAQAIDGNTGTGWASSPKLGEQRTAVFETTGKVGFANGTRLTVTLDQRYDDLHTIGRFRILVTGDARPVRLSGPPEAIAAILNIDAETRTGQQQRQLLDYYRTLDGKLAQLQQQIALLEKAEPPADSKLSELRAAVETSKQQLDQQRLIGAQDLAWALINSPAFLFNR